jgi:hypothetical protein
MPKTDVVGFVARFGLGEFDTQDSPKPEASIASGDGVHGDALHHLPMSIPPSTGST